MLTPTPQACLWQGHSVLFIWCCYELILKNIFKGCNDIIWMFLIPRHSDPSSYIAACYTTGKCPDSVSMSTIFIYKSVKVNIDVPSTDIFEVGYKGRPFQKLYQSMMMKSQISLLWHSISYWTGLLVKPGVMSWIQGFSRPLYGTSRELDILNRFFTTFS